MEEDLMTNDVVATTRTTIERAHCQWCGTNEDKDHSKCEEERNAKITWVNPNPGGRPCKYCENKVTIQTKTNLYLEEANKGINGKIIIPYIEELAMRLDETDENINNWVNKKNGDGSQEHPEFFTTIKKIKMIQKYRLLQRTNGRYNPSGAIFQLKANHGLIETEKKIMAGDSNAPMKLEVEIIEDRPKE